MITATHEGVTLATTTGSEEDVRSALGLEVAAAPPGPADEAPAPDEPEAAPRAEPEPEPEAEPQEPKRGSYQSRIDRLRAEATQAREQAAREAALRAELEARLRAAETAAAARQDAAADPEPKLDDFPENLDDYYQAHAAWHGRKAAKEEIAKYASRYEDSVAALRARVEAREAEQAHAEAQQHFQARLDAARSEFPDFDAVTKRSDLSVSQPVRDFILTSPSGARLAYAIGTASEEDVERLVTIPPEEPVRLGLEIGRLLARLDAASSGPASTAPRSSAPPPIKPVGGRAAAVAPPLETVDMKTFFKVRDKEEDEWRRSRL